MYTVSVILVAWQLGVSVQAGWIVSYKPGKNVPD